MCEKMIKNPYRRVWACVNLDALHDNLRQIAACRKMMPESSRSSKRTVTDTAR